MHPRERGARVIVTRMFWTTLRRAIAQLVICFYLTIFLLTALLAPGAPARCFFLLAACYGIAFVGLGVEWFWARWFATGIGVSGALSLLALLQVGLDPVVLVYGVSHALVPLLLLGARIAERYELKPGWRERLNVGEPAVGRLRFVFVVAGIAMPMLIVYAFGTAGASLGGIAASLEWLVL